ncbi:hypothetical protein [Rhodococcus sp. NPDC058521]|uniref:hypothetical protein n=1 Tax=Rhodococcus sp. NPDC058521 TaxID=3346536 RepID=UPI0036586E75
MTDSPQWSAGLLGTSPITIERPSSNAGSLAINDRKGTRLGSIRKGGNKFLRLLNELTDLFPHRPIEIRDSKGQPALRIEQRGLLRRHIVTVHQHGSPSVCRLVGKSLPGLRDCGYWVEVDGERVGEVVADKGSDRIVDAVGIEIAQIAKQGGERHGWAVPHYTPLRTTLKHRRRLSDSLAGLALAATLIRHGVL